MPRAILLLVLAPLAAFATVRADVVINEALPAPHADWNGNGVPSELKDEWVELANPGPTSLDLGDLYLAAPEAPSVPRAGLDGRLEPGAWLFVTGEQALDWQAEHGGSGGLALPDGPGSIALYRGAGGAVTLLDVASWDAAPDDVSFGRWPDGTGALRAFDALAEGGSSLQPTPGGANGGEASPKILDTSHSPAVPTESEPLRVRAMSADADGIAEAVLWVRVNDGVAGGVPMALVEGTALRGTWEGGVPAQPAGTSLRWYVVVSDGSRIARTNDETVVVGPSVASHGVALNEILADPPPDPDGDANGDGVRNSADDEFIEIVNHGPSAVDLSSWALADSTGVRHTFPAGLVLDAGEMYVVFGGGTPTGIPSRADVASTGTLSLNNTADIVRLLDVGGAVQDAHAYGPEANADQSLIRIPDGDGLWTRPHDAGYAWDYSPGLPNASPSAVSAASWAEIKAVFQK